MWRFYTETETRTSVYSTPTRKDVAAHSTSEIGIQVSKCVCFAIESANRHDSSTPAKIR